jgi:hypothetical protein
MRGLSLLGRGSLLRYGGLLAVAAAALIAFALYSVRANETLARPAFLTGYTLFGVLLALALFNVRKRLAMLPLGRAAYWLAAHVVGGTFALGLYFIHSGTIWPDGGYERALCLLFYLVTASGIYGYLVQRIVPRRLVQTGIEIIYERIPAELAELREQAEAAILGATSATGSDTLGRHYLETLAWFFARPRFYLSHCFGLQSGEHWLRHQIKTIDRYLNAAEREHLARLESLALYKNKVDFHYACQSVLKYWLLLHVPLSAGLLALMFWHVIVVNVYAL